MQVAFLSQNIVDSGHCVQLSTGNAAWLHNINLVTIAPSGFHLTYSRDQPVKRRRDLQNLCVRKVQLDRQARLDTPGVRYLFWTEQGASVKTRFLKKLNQS